MGAFSETYSSRRTGPVSYIPRPMPTPERVAPDEGGLVGLFRNAWGDLGDMVSGISDLIGAGVHDVGQLGEHALESVGLNSVSEQDKAESASPAGRYRWDDIALTALGVGERESPIVKDYKERYGSGWGKFAEGVYEHPLSFLTDLATVATAGGAAAAKGASVSAKLGGYADDVARIAEAGGDLARVGNVAPAAVRASKILGVDKQVLNPVTNTFETVAPIANPVRRALSQTLPRKLLTKPIEQFGSETRLALEAAQEAGRPGFKALNEARTAQEGVELAKSLGVTRAYRPGWATSQTKRLTDFIVGQGRSRFYSRRNDVMGDIERDFKPLLDEGWAAEDIYNALNDGVDYGGEVPENLSDVLRQRLGNLDLDTGERPRFDAADINDARNLATTAVQTHAPALMDEFGPEAVTHRIKSVDSIRRKQEATGQAADDIAGIRVTLPAEHVLDDPAMTVSRIEAATGGHVTKVDGSSLYSPKASGERFVELTLSTPEGPVNVQLGTSMMHRAARATEALKDWASKNPAGADKALALSRHAWEAVTDDLREHLTKVAPSSVRRATNNFRLNWFEKIMGPQIERGLLSPPDAFDRTYLVERMRRGTRFDKGADDFVGGPSSLELDAELAAAGRSAPVYFPHYDAADVSRSSFLMGGKLRRIKDPNLRRSEGSLLQDELDKGIDMILKDPVKAYQIRAAHALRAMEATDLVENFAQTFGRRLGRVGKDDLAGHLIGENETLLAPSLMAGAYRAKVGIGDDALAALADEGAAGMSKAARDALTEVMDANYSHFERLLKDVEGVEIYAIPKVVADRLQEYTRYNLGKAVRLFWDGPTNLWKQMVLTWSPRWLVNNVIGNSVFLKLQGGSITGAWRQMLDKRYREYSRRIIGEADLPDVEGGLFSGLGSYNTKLGAAEETWVGRTAQRIADTRPMGRIRKWPDMMHRFNSAIEDAYRRESYLTALDQRALRAEALGFTRNMWRSKQSLESLYRYGFNEKLGRRAIEDVDKVMNNYQRMSPLQRNVVKRIIPFWAFYRHAARTALTMPYEHPAKFRALQLLSEVDREMNPEARPEWMKDAYPMGDGGFLGTVGSNPFNVINEPFGLGLNPIFKVAYEQTTGKDMLTGRDFTGENVVEDPITGQLFEIREVDGAPVPVPIERNAPGLAEHFAQQVPLYEQAKNWLAGGKAYDTATIVDALQERLGDRGAATEIDPQTGEPVRPVTFGTEAMRYLGVPIYPYDLAAYQQLLAEQQQRALSQYQGAA